MWWWGIAGRNGAAFLIRGLGTVNNTGPLLVVDGMPDVDINRINVNDIETISVLKEATSASVYGVRQIQLLKILVVAICVVKDKCATPSRCGTLYL